MTHDEYVKGRRDGSINVAYSRLRVIGVVLDHLPNRYKVPFCFWEIVAGLSGLGCIYVAIFHKWWVGLILFLIVPRMIFGANNDSGMQFIDQYTIEDEKFCHYMIDHNLMIIRSVQDEERKD
jgi:hypothetical protein